MPMITRQKPKGQLPTAKSTRKPGERLEIDNLLSAWDFTDKFKIGVYGKSGTGKTTFWSTFPKPILAIICSGGKGELMSLSRSLEREGVIAKIATKTDHLRLLYDHAYDRQEQGKPYATIVNDHASGVQDLYLKEILKVDKIPEQLSWGLATQDQYGQCTMLCKEFFRQLLDLDSHVFLAVQEREFEKKKAIPGIPYIGPGLMPSLSDWFNSSVNSVVQTFIRNRIERKTKTVGQGKAQKTITEEIDTGEPEFCIRTLQNDTFETKFRIPRKRGFKLPPVIVDPTFDKIRALADSNRD